MKNLFLFLMRTRLTTRLLILIPLGIIILLNVHLASKIRDAPESSTSSEAQSVNQAAFSGVSRNENTEPSVVSSSRLSLGSPVPAYRALNVSEIYQTETTELNKNEILELIVSLNGAQKIRNEHLIRNLLSEEELIDENTSAINSSTSNSTQASQTAKQGKKHFYKTPKFLVILVQIHSRISYLEALIESLRNTKFIEQALVVFSHDLYIPAMNDLIKKIDFCATVQIFYPLSLQTHPDEFPGEDPNDCPKSIKKSEALIRNCNNAAHPDSYGNYREPSIVQIKHHWFWKLAFVFEHLNATKRLKNLNILLLEEDYYLMPDSIYILRKLTEKILSDIDVVSLAIFERSKQNLEFKSLHTYSKAIWHSNNHNTGLLLGRAQWLMIKDCLNAFCTYDDYNWDWTLQHISHNCFKLPLVSIFPVSSRVVHIGDCGIHHKSKKCDPSEKVATLKKVYAEKSAQFYPEELMLNNVSTGIRKTRKSNGGWSDPRDHQLCKSFVYPKMSSSDLSLNSTTLPTS